MDQVQRVELQQSEVREQLAALVSADEKDVDRMRELTKRAGELEVELRAAKLATPAPIERAVEGDGEAVEKRSLLSRSRLAGWLKAALDGSTLSGAEAECSAAYDCSGMIPLQKFGPVDSTLETRAATPVPSTTNRNMDAIVPAIFDRSVAPWLNISMPMVATGEQSYPVVTGDVAAQPVARGAAAPEQAGSFGVTTALPRRLSGAFRFQLEDAARLSGLEMSLQRNLRDVLSDAVDNQILNGSGSGDGTINGLLNILSDPTAPAATVTFDGGNADLSGHVDGLFAVDTMGVRVLVGPHTYRKFAQLFRTGSTANETLSAYISRTYGGLRSTRRIANPASNVQQAVIARANPAGDRVGVSPVWQGVQLIRDVYSGAKTGEVVVTAVMLMGDVVILRPGVFVQDSFKLA